MTRIFAVLFAVLIVLGAGSAPLFAQGRGGGFRGGGGGARGGGGVHVAPGPAVAPRPMPGPTFIGRGGGAVGRGSIVVGPHFGGGRVTVGRPGAGFIFRQPLGGFYSPFYLNPPLWNAPIWETPYYTAAPAYAAPAYVEPQVSQTDPQLIYEIERLRDEVERLRQQQQQPVITLPQASPVPPPQSVPEVPPTPATLVFRDGRRMLIQNYAIVRDTVWVLDEKSATKIAVSELDLEATQRENNSKGVRFPLLPR